MVLLYFTAETLRRREKITYLQQAALNQTLSFRATGEMTVQADNNKSTIVQISLLCVHLIVFLRLSAFAVN